MIKCTLLFLLGSITTLFGHDEPIFEALAKKEKQYLIPKIIHQIWVGKNKMHPECIKAIETWKKKPP